MPSGLGAFAHLGEMRVQFGTGLVHRFEWGAGQFELPAGLERDGAPPPVDVGQSPMMLSLVDDRLPAEEPLHRLRAARRMPRGPS
jgi:hypothetical protein